MATRINNEGEWQEKLTFFKKDENSDEVLIAVNFDEPNEKVIGVLKGEKFAKFIISLIDKNQKQ